MYRFNNNVWLLSVFNSIICTIKHNFMLMTLYCRGRSSLSLIWLHAWEIFCSFFSHSLRNALDLSLYTCTPPSVCLYFTICLILLWYFLFVFFFFSKQMLALNYWPSGHKFFMVPLISHVDLEISFRNKLNENLIKILYEVFFCLSCSFLV